MSEIYHQRTDGVRVLCRAASGGAAAAPELVLFSPVDWEIRFRNGSTPVDASGFTGQLIIKPAADFEGDARAILDFTEDGGTVTIAEDSLDSAELRADLDGKQSILYWGQLKWTPDGGTETRSKPFPLTIYNSPARPEETAPSPGSDAAWDILKTRLAAGSGITRTVNDSTKVITFAATAAYTGPELRLTGQVLEVEVAGVWRQIATLPAGSIV